MVSRYKQVYGDAKYDEENSLLKHSYLNDFRKSKKEVQKAGINCMYGTWTTEELEILYTSIEEYKSKYKITNFKEYFKNVIIPNRRVLEISRELGKNILRRLGDIYLKIYSEFVENDTDKESSLTKDEIKHLLFLQELHGNKWKLIAKIMGRNETQVRNFYHNYHSPYARRKIRERLSNKTRIDFFPSEDERLLSIIKEHATSKNGKIDDLQIDWLLVAKKLGTRSALSCRNRWEFYLSPDFNTDILKTASSNSKDHHLIQKELNRKILKLIIDEEIKNKDDVDWEIIANRVGGNYNPKILHQRFLAFIKRRSKKLIKGTFRETLVDIWENIDSY